MDVQKKKIKVNGYKLWNSNRNPQEDLDKANTIFAPANVELVFDTLKEIDFETFKENTDLDINKENYYFENGVKVDNEKKTFRDANSMKVYDTYSADDKASCVWMKKVGEYDFDYGVQEVSGVAVPDGTLKPFCIVSNEAKFDTFAHEMGHVLLDEGHVDSSDSKNLLMQGGFHRGKDVDNERTLTEEQKEKLSNHLLAENP